MARISDMLLPELYSRKMTSSVEKAILLKEDFSVKSEEWCDKVCRLNCKNARDPIWVRRQSDVLIIQDYSAFDEPKFYKRGSVVEQKHKDIVEHIAKSTLGYGDKRFTFALTNLVKCPLQKEDIKKGKAPTDTVLFKCRPYLLKEIEVNKPKVIISLNTVVTKALGFKKSNTRDCGDILDYNGIPVIVTLHPRILLMLRQNASGAYWGPDFYSMIEQDFQKATAILRGKVKIPNLMLAIEEAKKHIYVAQNIEDVRNFCEDILDAGKEGKICSFDIETTSLDPWAPEAKILCVQFGFRNDETKKIDSYVIPLWHRENKAYDPDLAWELVSMVLITKEVGKVGHNIKFDMLYTEVTTGIRVQGVVFDTMLLLHAINSGLQGAYGLKRANGNWLPELELSGYEDLLPKLSKRGEEDGTTGNIDETEEDLGESEEGS